MKRKHLVPVLAATLCTALLGCQDQTMPEDEDTFLVNVLENETFKPIEGTRLVVHDEGSDLTYERVTGADGIALLPEPAGQLTVKVFPPGHLPMYVQVEAEADMATMLSDAVDTDLADEGGMYFARGKGGLILEPLDVAPTPLRVRSIEVKRDMDNAVHGGMGSLGQTFYRGALPSGSVVTMKATWVPRDGAPITVHFLDALSGQSVGSVSGEFVNMEAQGVVQFVAPELEAMPEGTFAVAMADLAADPDAEDSAASANCCPGGSWGCACKDGPSTTQAVVNCCSAPTGATCSTSSSLSVSGSVTVSVPNVGSVGVTVNVSQSFTCTTPAKTCLAHKLTGVGCGYIVCDFWFGWPDSWCSNHGCSLNLCSVKSCSVPVTSCPAKTCSGGTCL